MEHLCTLKKEGSGYSLELSFDSIKSALDAALEILAFADADCYLANHPKKEPNTTPPQASGENEEFSSLLKNYRSAHNYSMREMARLLGVCPSTIFGWEAGHSPHPKTEVSVRNKLRKGEVLL